jgi:ubiquitin carboxyl-terminal hydrolase L5
MGDWITIESDPGVFTALLADVGVQGVEVEEIWDLSSLSALQPVYGLIFLFKWDQSTPPAPTQDTAMDTQSTVFFAKQVIHNACATQALLSVLLNRPEIQLGDNLTQFRDLVRDFPPDMKGLAISNNDVLRAVHNSFSAASPFINDGLLPDKSSDELYHFVAYVPCNGVLYELDGLQEGPIPHGSCTLDNWLDVVHPILQQRMSASAEIRFNLLAIVPDQLQVLEKRRQDLLNGLDQDASLTAQLSLVEDDIHHQQDKRLRYTRQNALRKHNFIPFIHALLTTLAERDKLDHAIQQSRQNVTTRRAAQLKHKQSRS